MSRLIIDYYHKACGHSGRGHVLSLIRERFWITQGSAAVKSVLAKCVICRRSQASLFQQSKKKKTDLQEDRVQPDRSPFTWAGLDFFGPFQVPRGRSVVKGYGVIFTCLAILAVHIEVAFSLDTDSFLLALRRFIARRGQVKETSSHNGTNPTSGERELHDATPEWNQASENPQYPIQHSWKTTVDCVTKSYNVEDLGVKFRSDWRIAFHK